MSLNIIELHAIIRFMTPNQKRRFTMQCQLSKPNSNSLVLFNALNKLKKYDREKLNKELQKIGRNKLVENLTTETILLYKLMLKIMKFSSDEKSVGKKLENDFNDIVFIQDQGFFLRSERMLKKIKKEAEKRNLNALLLSIYGYERSIKRHINEYKELSSIQEIHKKELELLGFLLFERKLKHIYDNVLFLGRNISVLKKSTANKLLDEIETALNIIDKKLCNYFVTEVLYINSVMELHKLKSDTNAALNCMEEMHRIYETYENTNRVSVFQYTRFLANYLNHLIIYNQPKDLILKILKKIKSVKPNTPREEMIKFGNTYYLEFLYYLKQGNFGELEKLVPALLEGLEKYTTDIALSRRVILWYNLMVYYFFKEDFDSTHLWIQKILNHGKKSRRIDILNNGKLLELLVHYELGSNITFLQSLIKKIKRSFKEVDHSKELLDLIAKMMSAYFKKGRLEKKDFEQALQKFNEIDKTKNEDLPYDEIEIWLKSKIHRSPMLEIAEEVLQKKYTCIY